MTPLDWFLVSLAALLVGLGKGGLVGVGNLVVLLFAMVFEAKASVGILLPVLISADMVAVAVYRRHAQWHYLRKVMPHLLGGIVLGYFLFGAMSNEMVERAIGGIVLGMTGIQILRTGAREYGWADWAERVPHSLGFRVLLGWLGGFATMVANAAGPVAQLYFISVGLPKLAFIGTGAWCFFILNVVKVPLQMELGILHLESLRISLVLAPLAMLGAVVAPRIVRYIPQKLFSWLVWVFIVVAGVKLLFW